MSAAGLAPGGLIVWIIVGLVAGSLASRIMRVVAKEITKMSSTNTLVQEFPVGEITEEQYGWIIAVDDPHVFHREIYPLQHRTWHYVNVIT